MVSEVLGCTFTGWTFLVDQRGERVRSVAHTSAVFCPGQVRYKLPCTGIMCTSGCSDAHSDADSILCWISAHLNAHVHIWTLRCTFRCWLYSVLNQCMFECSCAHLMLSCTFGCWLYSVLNQCTFRCSCAHLDAQLSIRMLTLFCAGINAHSDAHMHAQMLIVKYQSMLSACSCTHLNSLLRSSAAFPVKGSTLYQHKRAT